MWKDGTFQQHYTAIKIALLESTWELRFIRWVVNNRADKEEKIREMEGMLIEGGMKQTEAAEHGNMQTGIIIYPR